MSSDTQTQGSEEAARLGAMTHAGLDELQQYYDRWSSSYENDLLSMGYDAPERAAAALREQGIDPGVPILDAGCGTGLTGKALQAQGFERVTGLDISGESLAKAKAKGCYERLVQCNLNEPLALDDDAFGAAQCIGTLTYVDNIEGLMRELCRVVRPTGVVQFTHRQDLYDDAFSAALARLVGEGVWSLLSHSTPQPYIPQHADFDSAKDIYYDMYRVL